MSMNRLLQHQQRQQQHFLSHGSSSSHPTPSLQMICLLYAAAGQG
jgi:hypothetical protein